VPQKILWERYREEKRRCDNIRTKGTGKDARAFQKENPNAQPCTVSNAVIGIKDFGKDKKLENILVLFELIEFSTDYKLAEKRINSGAICYCRLFKRK